MLKRQKDYEEKQKLIEIQKKQKEIIIKEEKKKHEEEIARREEQIKQVLKNNESKIGLIKLIKCL